MTQWVPEFLGRSAVVVCQKGLKLSHGVAAWLRQEGVPTESLDGGRDCLGSCRSAHGA